MSFRTAIERRLRGYVPRRPVAAGALVTAAATLVLFSIPELVDFETFRRTLYDRTDFYFLDNPFPPLRLLGGIVGGYVAGYLTAGRWYDGFVNGIKAVLLGIGIYYVGTTGWTLLRVSLGGGLTGDAVLIIVLGPLFFVLVPYGMLYLFEATFSSLIGYTVASKLEDTTETENAPEATEATESTSDPPVTREDVFGTLGLFVFFVVVWAFVFYVEAQYFPAGGV